MQTTQSPKAGERTQHTPGPWEATNMGGRIFPSVFLGPELSYSDDSGKFRARIVINEGPTADQVAKGKGFGTTLATCQANARLIAAAPELLDALKDAEAWIGEVVGMSVEANSLRNLFLDKSRAAIAKAEGTNL